MENVRVKVRGVQSAARGLETYLFYASLVVLFVTVSEVVDLFELPFESVIARLMASGSLVSFGFVTSLLTASGYLGIFILMALESASLPVPSELVLPFSGYLVFEGSLNFAGVVAVSTVAGMVGALVGYYLALKFGRPLVRGLFKRFGASGQALDRTENWVNRKGSWSILAARFVPGIRTIVSLPAGALKMRLRTFVSMTFAGTLGWSALLVYVGYSTGNLWQTALAQSSPLFTSIPLSAGLVVSSSYILYYLVHRPRVNPD
jgi:membrane protein DedA with SNARE-associated domain